MELYKKYRPTMLKQLVGQPNAIAILRKFIKENNIPHALSLVGPSGCGKTTIGRILATKLECSESDFVEINCADFRGIDTIRDIRQRMGLSPLGGKTRIWLIDEAHKLSNDAQTALLKMLEDTPNHVYFFLATTESNKLLKTIQTRCTSIVVKSLQGRSVHGLLEDICKKEKKTISEEVREKVVEYADGSARKALVLLNQIINLPTEEEQLEAVQPEAVQKQGIEIAKALMAYKKTSWSEMAEILKSCTEEPESLRWMVLSYASKVLLGGGKLAPRAFVVIDAFRDHFYDSKRAGLIASCYEILTSNG